MCAFSYAWSLPVTWRSWRSHRWIRHNRISLCYTQTSQQCLIEPELLLIKVLHWFSIFLLLWPWPWPNDIHIRSWLVFPGDKPDVQKWTSYVKAFESYYLTDIQTDRQMALKLCTTLLWLDFLLLSNDCGQVVNTQMSLWPSSVIWNWPNLVISSLWSLHYITLHRNYLKSPVVKNC